ncbi:hypothetical protein [Alkalicoccus halolimnae]|uniref:Uncharacterized protein n=1 Tax=Alkalicoccus halolimnae TaxID=1667239 RepID=A0A5C7FKM9_9BACI|nr:hypothetical protein [Alkalicoccus halolimnae]TXF85375.1 hypothetical protein FTX54_09345 [Alkalicoccus halolimnae]
MTVDFSYFIMNLVIISIVLITFAVLFRNKKKKDKGWVFNYFKLSYRRKLIRTWVSLPFSVAAILLLYFINDWAMQIYILLGVLLMGNFIIQLIYNYVRWNREERE